ncbi:MAG: sialidase family protein [Bacteroidota bacterium]
MKQKKSINYLFLLMVIFASACSPKIITNPSQEGKMEPVMIYSTIPLLKGMPFNFANLLQVYVPQGRQINYRSFQIQLDEEAVKAIEKIDILVRDDLEKGFLKGATIYASVSSLSTTTNVPVDIPLKQGWNNIYLSIVLKKDADIDKKIFLRVKSVTASNNDVYQIKKSIVPDGRKPDYKRRMGIVVRKAWDDSVHTYRIPGVITTDKGTLIAVYDIRYKNSGDLPGDINVGMSRSTDGGHTWQPMKVIMAMGPPHENNGVGDPSVLFDPVTKKLWVAALWSKGNRSIAGSKPGLSPDITGQFVLASSDDDGLTWSTPASITAQVKNPIWHLYFNAPGNGIAMQNGTLVFPSQYWDETTNYSSVGIPHSSIIYSEDHGKTWKSGTGARSNTTESQVVETTPGTLMLNMRDNRGKVRSIATTTDMGKTWVEDFSSYYVLPDPISMGSFIKARVNVKGKMKEVLFFSNVASQTIRQLTTIKASLDLGKTWLPKNQLLIDERTTFGYSALTKIDDNTIGILYEGDRDLYFVRVPVKDIIK